MNCNFVEVSLFHLQLRFDYVDFVFLMIDSCLILTHDVICDVSKPFPHSFHNLLNLIARSCIFSLF